VNHKSHKPPGNFIWLFNWEVTHCLLGKGQSHLGEAESRQSPDQVPLTPQTRTPWPRWTPLGLPALGDWRQLCKEREGTRSTSAHLPHPTCLRCGSKAPSPAEQHWQGTTDMDRLSANAASKRHRSRSPGHLWAGSVLLSLQRTFQGVPFKCCSFLSAPANRPCPLH